MSGTIVLLSLAVGTYVLKSAAPLLLGGRRLPESFGRIAELLPAALLAALVLASAVTRDGSLHVDARIAGLVTATVALLRRAPFVVVVGVAAVATALVRGI
jgi:branched-subunit amino acid transport protein